MRIIAFIDEGEAIRKILQHLGEPIEPPKLAPARGPPLWEAAGQGHADPLQERIENPLSRLILDGTLGAKDRVKVEATKGQISFVKV